MGARSSIVRLEYELLVIETIGLDISDEEDEFDESYKVAAVCIVAANYTCAHQSSFP